MDRITTVFAAAPARQSPNLRTTSDGAARAAYLRAMLVMFASARRAASDSDLALTVVTDLPIDEPHGQRLTELRVDVQVVPFGHRPPDGFAPTFAASLYMLDAIGGQEPGDTVLYVDPDVVFVRDPLALIHSVPRASVGALPLLARRDTCNNGLDRAQAAAVYAAWDNAEGSPAEHRKPASDFQYYGGECYVITADALRAVQQKSEQAWARTLDMYRAGARHYPRTEEHLMNHVLRSVDVAPLAGQAARVWTTGRVRVIPPGLDDHTLWHVPAEKGDGFDRLHPWALDRDSWFWTADPATFRAGCAMRLGVRGREPRRLLRDAAGLILGLPRRMADRAAG